MVMFWGITSYSASSAEIFANEALNELGKDKKLHVTQKSYFELLFFSGARNTHILTVAIFRH